MDNADNTLTYTVTGNTNAGLFTSVTVTGGQNLVLNYAPNANGSAQITVRATDPGALFVETTFTVTVPPVNAPPVFTSAPVTAATEDAPYSYAITTSDPDAGDTLTITAPTLTAWLTLADNGDGTASLTGTPANANVGVHNVTLRVSDGTVSVDQTFTVTVANVNNAPVFTSTPVTAATEDSPYIYNVTVTDADLGDVLTITVPTLPARLSLTDNGGGTAVLAGMPANADVGVNNVTLRASDGTVNVNQTFTITVTNTNDAPTDIALSNDMVNEGMPAGTPVGTFSTSDPDAGDTFTYSFCGGADDASFQISGNALQTNAVFDADVQSTFVICIHSEDAGGMSFEKAFTITINNINDAPLIVLQSVSKSVNESTPLFFDDANSTRITISDPDAGTGSIQVTLSVAQGALTLASTSGLTFTPPADGSGDTSMTLTGVLTAVNAALDGMRYDPPAGYNGSDTLQNLGGRSRKQRIGRQSDRQRFHGTYHACPAPEGHCKRDQHRCGYRGRGSHRK